MKNIPYLNMMLIFSVACAPLTASDPAHIKTWQKQYFLDKNLGQEYLNTLASYISYLMQTKPDEIKKYLQEDIDAAMKSVSKINGSENKVPNTFKLALIKVFKNAYSQAYKDTMKIEKAKKAQLAALLARRRQKGTNKKPSEQPATEKIELIEDSRSDDQEPTDTSDSLHIDRCAWKQALNNYYATIYALLDDQHKTFNYGHRRGKTLPAPKPVKMVDPIDPCKDIQ